MSMSGITDDVGQVKEYEAMALVKKLEKEGVISKLQA